MSATSVKSLIQLSREQYGMLVPFLPDVPWTTPLLHALAVRRASAYVDAPESPRNIVVEIPGDSKKGTRSRVYLYGKQGAEGIAQYLSRAKAPIEFFADPDLQVQVQQAFPTARPVDHVIAWFDTFEVELERDLVEGLRRVRPSDAKALEAVLPDDALQTYGSARDMLLDGAAYGVFVDDEIRAVAYSVDHSNNFERIAVATSDEHRRHGYAVACVRRLAGTCSDRGRIPCAWVEADNGAAFELVQKAGFTRFGRLRSLRV